MRRVLSWAAAAAILAIPASVWGQQVDSQADQQGQAANSSTAQSSAPKQESLADAARKAREAKKDQPKTAKVFDNDSLPGASVAVTAKADEDKKDGDAAADGTKASPSDEKKWRDKFAQLRAKLARDQEDLGVMQRELGVLNVQNYTDPVKGMQQELTRGDINKKTADIDAKQKQIDADQQAIADAEDDLRKAGGDSGWAR